MLAYVLSLAVGLGSIAVYLAAFFFPEIHRKNDFIWSGVGFFYALVLWVFAPRITGGLLLGHVASVSLLYWFGWQTLSLRRLVTPQVQQTPVPSTETVQNTVGEQVNKLSLPERLAQLQKSLGNTFSGAKDKVQQTASKKTADTKTATPAPTTKPPVEVVDKRTVPEPAAPTATVDTTATTQTTTEVTTQATTESVTQLIPPNPPSPELVEAAKEAAKEEKTPLSAEEIAPDAALAPPAEAPPEQIPPTDTPTEANK